MYEPAITAVFREQTVLPHASHMRFLVPDRARLPEGAIDLAYLANFEESPYPAPVRWQDNTLVLQHHSGESGALTIPWLIGDRPPIALTTGTLIDRPRP